MYSVGPKTMTRSRTESNATTRRCPALRVAPVLLVVVLFGAAGAAADRAGHTGIDAATAHMDELWAHRDQSGAMQELVAAGTNALAADPHNFDAEWRLARAYFWVAYTQPSRIAKKGLARTAMEWADHARTDRPDRVEGHYLFAISAGEYANTIGAAQALVEGLAGKVESAALRAYAIDRDYSNGAPGTVLGRYYFMLPWPMRDLERSRHYLEEVVARHSGALIARDYLADTYYELGEREQARAQLTFVLANNLMPGTELDLPAPKTLAREAMERWFPEADSGHGAARH
jgi:hypothetical protein